MIKPWIATLSLLAGAATVGVALYVQVNPRAFTTATEPAEDTARVTTLDEVQVLGELPVASIEIEPVHIQAMPPSVATEPVGPPLATRPCSDWWELGPKATSAGQGARHVRRLCM